MPQLASQVMSHCIHNTFSTGASVPDDANACIPARSARRNLHALHRRSLQPTGATPDVVLGFTPANQLITSELLQLQPANITCGKLHPQARRHASQPVVTAVSHASAGILIEDQVAPKSCGHVRDKQVVSRDDACARIQAAVDAREEGADILIVARSDARQVQKSYPQTQPIRPLRRRRPQQEFGSSNTTARISKSTTPHTWLFQGQLKMALPRARC